MGAQTVLPEVPRCPTCGSELNLIQPDAATPKIVMGVCRCGAAWRMQLARGVWRIASASECD